MHYIIAVFRSRNETLYMANMFKSRGFYADIINTPKEAGEACGISVRFDERLLDTAKGFLQSKPFRSFTSFYRVSNDKFGHHVEKILI